MSKKNYYKKLFYIEKANIENKIFKEMDLSSEWQEIGKNGIFQAIGLIDDTLYYLYFNEEKGFLIVPAETSINSDFDSIIRYIKTSNNIDYTIYTRKNNMLYENKYYFTLFDDSILLNYCTKIYNINCFESIYDPLVFYDDEFLEDKLYDICSSVIVNKQLDKITYIKHNNRDNKDTYKEIDDNGFYLYDIANYVMKEKNDLNYRKTI